MKVRRRLARIGAVPIKNGAYVLPSTDESHEDFRWLRAEIVADGGDAIIGSIRFLDGLRDEHLMSSDFARREATPVPETFGTPVGGPRGARWVTRAGVRIDRMASAWLIRRFIDPRAHFAFVPTEGYRPASGEIRFDMFEGEHTHEGDRCTFEVLLTRFALTDPALTKIGEIVHDLDCKDGKFGHAETAGIGVIIAGLAHAEPGDAARVTMAGPLFDGLHAGFGLRA